MKRAQPKPRRPLRNELLALLPILLIPTTLVLVFPYQAIAFRVARFDRETAPSCAYVQLADGVEAKAMELVRAAFSVASIQNKGSRSEMSLSTLPEEQFQPLVDIRERATSSSERPLRYEAFPLPPTLAAPELKKLDSLGVSGGSAVFSRETLLQLDFDIM